MPCTAIVRFAVTSRGGDRAEIVKQLQDSVPKFRGMPGLIRKYYLLSDDGKTSGGAYLWETRAAAEAYYTPAWRASMKARFGAEPTVEYFESPVIVDNAIGEVSIAAE